MTLNLDESTLDEMEQLIQLNEAPNPIVDKLRELGYGGTVTARGEVLFCHMVDTATEEEAHDVVYSRYCEISTELGDAGLQLVDVYLEHDCINGNVVWKGSRDL